MYLYFTQSITDRSRVTEQAQLHPVHLHDNSGPDSRITQRCQPFRVRTSILLIRIFINAIEHLGLSLIVSRRIQSVKANVHPEIDLFRKLQETREFPGYFVLFTWPGITISTSRAIVIPVNAGAVGIGILMVILTLPSRKMLKSKITVKT